METGAAAGRLLPAADLADLHLGPVGGAQHLLPRPGRPQLPGGLRAAGGGCLAQRGCRGRRTLPQGTVGEGRYLGGAGRTAPGKPRQHAAKRRGVEPPDLHAQARLADEPAPAGRTAVRQHRVPPTSRAGPAGNPVTGAPAARRADPLDPPGHPRHSPDPAGRPARPAALSPPGGAAEPLARSRRRPARRRTGKHSPRRTAGGPPRRTGRAWPRPWSTWPSACA